MQKFTHVTNIFLNIINAGAGAGSSDVIGFDFTSSSVPGSFSLMVGVSAVIFTTGGGRKRGVLMEGVNLLSAIGINISVNGGTDSIGMETNSVGAVINAESGSVGGSTADISQTQGELGITGTYLVHSTANNLGFNSLTYPANYSWGDPDIPIGAGLTLYMRPGTSEASAVPIFISALQKFVAFEMVVRVIVPPGMGQSTTWILQRNGVDTPMSLTLTDLNVNEELYGVSVHFEDNDDISMKMVTSAGAATGDALVQVAIY
jgi:hypothetical protein